MGIIHLERQPATMEVVGLAQRDPIIHHNIITFVHPHPRYQVTTTQAMVDQGATTLRIHKIVCRLNLKEVQAIQVL